MANWIKVTDELPPREEVVETKIDDGRGVRNQQSLKLGDIGFMWGLPDYSMYVYYTPTHWRRIPTL